ncbi:PadR family transcriptional regulator [Bordetella genomosp. 11]|uniref:PadR family transcriptional regulator n=1 Tax=Bordetella genomosp. 11 TaxID=1416808 RepID=A0A261UES5_9BORD|nr:PadR family transcriptional regulator [Bordetella genomosp. 11]OZI60091.1 PadR family transcriptional regulator [Bordetella genomosp. 11]
MHFPFHHFFSGRHAWVGRAMHHRAMAGRAGGGHRGGHGHHDHGDDADGGGGDRGWVRGRKFGGDELQLMLLGILEQNPSHGYELIKALDAMSSGYYTPSPGMIYPALTYLEEIGYATVELEGSKKRYRLADPGRAHLDANRERLALLFGKLKHIARKMEWMRRAWTGQPMEAGPNGEDVATGWVPELVQARQALKQALFRRDDADPAEQRRIAAILMRAVNEICGDAKA